MNQDLEENTPLIVEEQQVGTVSSEGTSRKMNAKIVVAAVATLSLVALAVATRPQVNSNMPSVASLKEIDPTVDFTTGDKITTQTVPDGTADVLGNHDLSMSCENNAMVGFTLFTDVVEDVTNVGYDYYCDDAGAPMDNKNSRVSDNSIDPGSPVGQLSVFDVDCARVGMNYVLTYLQLAEQDNGKYAYEYGCATYELGMLTCAQFYTDLAAESDVLDSVSTLKNHPVQCFEGSALQHFRYQRVDEEVRYSYLCCTKAHIPTPSPTPLPTLEPTFEPTLAPNAKPTMEPVADSTLAPVAEKTAQPSDEPTTEPIAEPTLEPSQEPSLSPRSKPTSEPNAAKTEEPTQEPTVADTLKPTETPLAEPTIEPTVKPSMEPSAEPPVDPVLVVAEHLPRYCPFTYLQGTSKLEIIPGCVFISQDQLIYMRNEETSPSVYVCTSSDAGDVEVTHKDLARYGLISLTTEGTVSDVRVGADTAFTMLNKAGGELFVVTPDDMRLVKERRIDEADIYSGVLTTTVTTEEFTKVPVDCGDAEDNAEAAQEGNEEMDDDKN